MITEIERAFEIQEFGSCPIRYYNRSVSVTWRRGCTIICEVVAVDLAQKIRMDSDNVEGALAVPKEMLCLARTSEVA